MEFIYVITFLILFNFIYFSQPFALVMLLIFQTLPVIMLGLIFSESSWISYITFLIYLGGLLIIFIYISALIPNQLFSYSWLGISAVALLAYNTNMGSTINMSKFSNTVDCIAEFSYVNSSTYICIMIGYLLMILFSIAGLTNFIKSPLKAY